MTDFVLQPVLQLRAPHGPGRYLKLTTSSYQTPDHTTDLILGPDPFGQFSSRTHHETNTQKSLHRFVDFIPFESIYSIAKHSTDNISSLKTWLFQWFTAREGNCKICVSWRQTAEFGTAHCGTVGKIYSYFMSTFAIFPVELSTTPKYSGNCSHSGCPQSAVHSARCPLLRNGKLMFHDRGLYAQSRRPEISEVHIMTK